MSIMQRTNLCTSLTFMLGLIVGLLISNSNINLNNIIVIVFTTVVFHLTHGIPTILVKKSE